MSDNEFDKAIIALAGIPEEDDEEESVSDLDLAVLAYVYAELGKFSDDVYLYQKRHFQAMSYHYSDCLDAWISVEHGIKKEDILESTLSLKYYYPSSCGKYHYKPMEYLQYISANALEQAKNFVHNSFKEEVLAEEEEHYWKIIHEIYQKLGALSRGDD